MDSITSLKAALSGSDVVLTWTLDALLRLATAVQVQRAFFGSANWSNIGASLTPATLTATDTAPEAGEYSYRLAITVTQGGVDNAGTLLYSNQVNISTLATTGAVTLSGSVNAHPTGPNAGPANYSLVSLSWTVDNAGANDDDVSAEIQRSLDAGVHWRHVVTENEFGPGAVTESIPTGTGSVQYRVLVSVPQGTTAAGQLNAPEITTSNVVTLTV